MSLIIILAIGMILTIIFHFVGVYAGAKKIVWVMLVIAWAGSINIATSEVKPKAYEDLKKMQGKYSETDKLIEEAGESISIYEMIGIKNSFIKNKKK